MPWFAGSQDLIIHAVAIVSYLQVEPPLVLQLDPQIIPARVSTRITDSFMSDAIHLVPGDGVHLSDGAQNGNVDRHPGTGSTVIGYPVKRAQQIV